MTAFTIKNTPAPPPPPPPPHPRFPLHELRAPRLDAKTPGYVAHAALAGSADLPWSYKTGGWIHLHDSLNIWMIQLHVLAQAIIVESEFFFFRIWKDLERSVLRAFLEVQECIVHRSQWTKTLMQSSVDYVQRKDRWIPTTGFLLWKESHWNVVVATYCCAIKCWYLGFPKVSSGSSCLS